MLSDLQRLVVLLRDVAQAVESVARELDQDVLGPDGSTNDATLHEAPSTPEPYLNAEEIADRLGYSSRWVYDRVRFDGLPSYQRIKKGRRRFLWSEVERWYDRETARTYPSSSEGSE